MTEFQTLISCNQKESDSGNLQLEDIIDIPSVQKLLSDFYQITAMPSTIMDNRGKVLASIGWQDICTKYHRSHPETLKNCLESDALLSKGAKPGTFKAYRCRNGLIDMATPIEVEGHHLGNFYLGQFFYIDEEPDLDEFRQRAQRYGFDETEYLAALNRVPRFHREKVDDIMGFYSGLAAMISSLSFSNASLAKAVKRQQEAEEELRLQNGLLTSLLDSIPDLVFYKDMKGVFQGCNRAFAEMEGLEESEIVGKTDYDLYNRGIADFFRVNDKKAMEQLSAHRNEEWINFSDGRKVLMDTIKTPYCDQKGNPIGILGIARDITDRKRYENELKESERKHRRLFETMSPGVTYQDSDGRIISANPSAERMLGITLDQMQGKTSADPRWKMIREDGSFVPGTEHPTMTVLRTGKKMGPTIRGVFIPEKNEYVWLSITAIPLFREGEKKPFQAYSVFDDITDAKQSKEKLQRYAQELEQKNKELDIAVYEAEKANKAKSEFLASMNHEIRTPINGLLGFLQLLEDTPISEEQAEFLGYMNRSAQHLLSLVNNVLDMSKIEAGEMDLDHNPFNLSAEIDNALASLRPLAREKGLRLSVDKDPGLPMEVLGDSMRLRQIILNLMGNAVKFTEEGSVHLAIASLGKKNGNHYLQLEVRDTGPGMEQSSLDQLFQPFYQERSSQKKHPGGTGLGLTITRELVERMGGQIHACSSPGKGSSFIVRLNLEEKPT